MSTTKTNETLFIDIFLSEELYDEFCDDDPFEVDECDDDECDDDLADKRWRKLLDEYEGFIHVHFGSDLSNDIQESMAGKRHLVHLHRLNPVPAYSRETDYYFYDQGLTGGPRFTKDDVLACLEQKFTWVFGAPRGPVFYGTYNEAREIVDDVRHHLISWRRAGAGKSRNAGRHEKADSSYDRQGDPDSVGSKAWLAALMVDIARCREMGKRHSRRMCDILDGLHGHEWQEWLERKLEMSPSDGNSVPEARKLRCITCGHSFATNIVDRHNWVRCPGCGFNTPVRA